LQTGIIVIQFNCHIYEFLVDNEPRNTADLSATSVCTFGTNILRFVILCVIFSSKWKWKFDILWKTIFISERISCI